MQTLTPIEYLKVDIANNFSGSLDKQDWDDRIAWFDENEEHISELVDKAEDPALYYAGVEAYDKALSGKPSGYPISLDACSSGLQILACLVGCEDSAKLCGVVSTGHREDAYTNIYQFMCDEIGDAAKIDRKDTKHAIMTSLYASTAIPKEVFGEGELLEVYHNTMEEKAPGAWELNKSLQELWQPDALSHDWVLPDNFHAHIKVMEGTTQHVQFMNEPIPVHLKENIGTKEGRSISPNIIHSIDGMIVREITRRCSFNRQTIIDVINALDGHGVGIGREEDLMVAKLWTHYLESGFLSTRILPYLDKTNMGLVDPLVIANMVKTLPEEPFEVISIHDCFRVLPNHGNDLRHQYNQILSDISKSDLLSYIASQVVGKKLQAQKFGDISAQILEADYTLS